MGRRLRCLVGASNTVQLVVGTALLAFAFLFYVRVSSSQLAAACVGVALLVQFTAVVAIQGVDASRPGNFPCAVLHLLLLIASITIQAGAAAWALASSASAASFARWARAHAGAELAPRVDEAEAFVAQYRALLALIAGAIVAMEALALGVAIFDLFDCCGTASVAGDRRRQVQLLQRHQGRQRNADGGGGGGVPGDSPKAAAIPGDGGDVATGVAAAADSGHVYVEAGVADGPALAEEPPTASAAVGAQKRRRRNKPNDKREGLLADAGAES